MKESVKKISLVGLGNMLNAGLGFLFLSAVARELSVDQFGKYALLISLLIFLSKIMDFGTNSNFVAKSIASEDKNLAQHFISSKILLFVVSLLISILLLFVFKMDSALVILIFVAGLIFYGINYTLFGLFQSLEKYFLLVLLNSIPALIKGFFAILVLTGHVDLNLEQFFMVFSFAIGPSSLLYFFLPKNFKKLKLEFSKTGQIIKQAISPGISQLINEGFPAVSNTVVKIFTDFAGVGIYSLADKISSAFVLVSFTIFTVLLPKNAVRKKEEKGYDFKETALLATGVFLLSIATIVFAKYFVPWFFQNKYDESIRILNILVIAGGISAIHTFMENYFFVENKTKYLAFISGGKLTVFLTFALILTPIYSIVGLAYSHLIAATSTLVFMLVLMKKDSFSSHPQKQISD